MSRFVDELIISLKEDSHIWEFRKDKHAIVTSNTMIIGYGNSALLSTVHVFINGIDMDITYCDRFKLDLAISHWLRNIPLHYLKMTNA